MINKIDYSVHYISEKILFIRFTMIQNKNKYKLRNVSIEQRIISELRAI